MIIQYLKSFNIFTDEQIEEFIDLTTKKNIKKNSLFVEEDTVNKQVAFIDTGIFRSYYTNMNGDEITYCFRYPGELLAAYSSYITGQKSVENLQAITDSTLTVITKQNLENLINKHQSWLIFSKITAEQQYLELEQRIFQLQKTSAKDKYELLFKKQPEYIKELPLNYLASYLGISQRHLSRIRREISF